MDGGPSVWGARIREAGGWQRGLGKGCGGQGEALGLEDLEVILEETSFDHVDFRRTIRNIRFEYLEMKTDSTT